MITQRYNLNLIPDRVPVIVNCSQYDANSRTIEMTIYDGSVLYAIPSGTTATVRGTKSDNTGFEYPCSIDGSVVSFDIQDQMTIFAGKVPCEIRLADANGFVGTCNFLLNVEETPLDPDITISESDLPLLEEAEQNAIRAEQARDEAEELLSSVVKSVNGETPDANGNVDVIALPTGGTIGQVLTKQSSRDFDANWQNIQKMDFVSSPTANDILLTDANGQAIDSGRTLSEFQELLTAGNGIDITNGEISNNFDDLQGGADLNTVTYQCIAYCRDSCVNKPTSYGGVLISKCRNSDTQYGAQFFICYSSVDKGVYYRTRDNGTWRAWRKISDSYMDGDTVTNNLNANGHIMCEGAVTSNSSSAGTQIRFTIPLNKPVDASNVTFSNLPLTIRSVDGLLLGGSSSVDVITASGYTVTSLISVSGINVLLVMPYNSNATVNTPVSVRVAGMNATFS